MSRAGHTQNDVAISASELTKASDIRDFAKYLSDDAWMLYHTCPPEADGIDRFEMIRQSLRYLYVVVDLGQAIAPSAADIATLAEMFSHGVSRGIFHTGVYAPARWARLKKNASKAILMLYPISDLSQEEISSTYSMLV